MTYHSLEKNTIRNGGIGRGRGEREGSRGGQMPETRNQLSRREQGPQET